MGPKVETPVTHCFLLFVLLPPKANDSFNCPSPLCVLIYSSTDAACRGGSVGKTDKREGLPVVQG
jgi:hypothetical protein